MAAPTLIQYAQSSWTTTTTTIAVPGLTWQAGDVLIAVSGNSNSQSNFSAVPVVGGGSFTFTAIPGCAQSATGTECATNAWVGTAPSNGSGLAITFSGNAADTWGAAVWIWRGCGGIGNVAVGTTSADTVALTRQSENSCVLGAAFDWRATATTGYGWTPAATNDRQHVQEGTQYSVFVADWGGQGSAGTTNYGVTGFTTLGPFSKVFIEVLGVPAFDSVGPSSSGIGQASGATLSWTHTTVGAPTLLLVAFSPDNTGNSTPGSVTCGGASMTQVGPVVPSGVAGTTGNLQVFSISGLSAGAHAIVVTLPSGVTDSTGGSVAFTGAGGLGTVYTSSGSATGSQYSIADTANTSGNIIAGFVAAGNTITGTNTPAVSRFLNNLEAGAGAATGNIAGATAPATGSSVSVVWTGASTVAATLAVEVLASAGPASPATLAGTAQPGPAWLARFKGQHRKPQIPFPPPFVPPVSVAFPPPQFLRPAISSQRLGLRRSKGQFFSPGQFNEVAPQLPGFTDLAGSRPKYAARISRGRFFDPPWGQGNQGIQFPLFTRQAQSRRLTLRRSEGNFFSPGQFNNVAPVLPSFPRQRQRNTLRRSQGQFFNQAWGQGNQGTQFPLYLRQSYSQRLTLRRSEGNFFSPGQFNNTAPVLPNFTRQAAGRKLALRRSQGVFFNQSWGQGNQGTNFPSFMDPAGYRPRWGPRISRGRFSVVFSGPAAVPPPQFVTRQERSFPARAPRGRFQVPGLGQGNQGVVFPLYGRQAGNVSRWTLRNLRGRFFGITTAVIVPPPPQFIVRQQRMVPFRIPHGHYQTPGLGQANQGAQFPLYMRQAESRRLTLRRSQGRFSGVPSSFTAPAIPQFIRGTYNARLIVRAPRGSFSGQVWPQASQGARFPLFTRQNTRKLARAPKGQFFTPGQFSNVAPQYPNFTKAAPRPVPARVNRGKFWAPGQFNETAPQLPSFTRTAKRLAVPGRHGTYFQVYRNVAPPQVPGMLSPRRPKLSPPRRGNVFRFVPPPAVIPVFPPEFKVTKRPNFTWMRRRIIVRLVPFQTPSTADIKFTLGVPQSRWMAGNAKTNWRVP